MDDNLFDFIDSAIDVVRRKYKIKKRENIEENKNINNVPIVVSGFHIKKKKKKEKKEEKNNEKIEMGNKNLYKLPQLGEKISDTERLGFFLNVYGMSQDKTYRYPVTKIKIKGIEYTFSYADIRWDPEIKELVYNIIEPPLSKEEWDIVNKILHILENIVDIPLEYTKDENKAREYIIEKTDYIIKREKLKIDKNRLPFIYYYVLRETVGYGKIDTLMRDPNIEDISCNGVNIPIYIFHRNPLVGEVRTNIVFTNEEELDNFVVKLSVRAGRSVSVAKPLLDAALPDGSRIQITFGSDISRKGSSFTIRKFPQNPFTPIDLLQYGTVDYEMLAYLWTLIEEGKSLLISGGTATGKTSFLNAISLFIHPDMKIITIEDTPELMLPHINWLQEVARPGYGPSNYGEVSMFDLLKASLRQRPDYLIVGEVRGEEAYILFQAMATGHAGLGTIHAETMEALIDRLTTPPISLPYSLLEILDGVVFLKRLRYKGRYVRRVSEIYEIIGYNKKKKDLDYIESYRWNVVDDSYIAEYSYKLEQIKEIRNWSDEELISNLKFKISILKFLYKNRINDYRKIGEVISLYYYDPERLAKIVGFIENQ